MSNDTPTPEAKIAELVRAGQLSASEGRRLKSALPGQNKPAPLWRLFIDPWDRLSERAQLALALVTALASVALSILGDARFDGTLDLHLSVRTVAWKSALLDQGAAWLLTAAIFWLVAKLAKARARIIDLVLAIGAARLPLVLSGIVLIALPLPRDPAAMLATSPALLVALAFSLLPLIAWLVVLLYTGWRHATGLRAPRVGISFVIALMVSEVISKGVLSVAA